MKSKFKAKNFVALLILGFSVLFAGHAVFAVPLLNSDPPPPPPPAQCGDSIDNDSDGLIDYPADPGCTSTGDPSEIDPACVDGIDNDGDGLIDYPADPGCTSTSDTDETNPPGGVAVDYTIRLSCFRSFGSCNASCGDSFTVSDTTSHYVSRAWRGSYRSWDDAMGYSGIVNGTTVFSERSDNSGGVTGWTGRTCGCGASGCPGVQFPSQSVFFQRSGEPSVSIRFTMGALEKFGGTPYRGEVDFGYTLVECLSGYVNVNGSCILTTGTIIVESINAFTFAPLSSAWQFLSFPSTDPCASTLCQGTSKTYTSQPIGIYTILPADGSAGSLFTLRDVDVRLADERPDEGLFARALTYLRDKLLSVVHAGWVFQCSDPGAGIFASICSLALISDGTIIYTLNWDPVATMDVSPTSFTFSAVEGGANPVGSLSIANSGEGTSLLNWSATPDQPWLIVGPPSVGTLSGGDAASVLVTADISGLLPGSRSGTITLTGTNQAGFGVPPQVISVSLTVTSPLSCSPPSQDVAVGAPAALSASGGDGTYAWSAPGGTPSTGSGSAFAVAYSTGGLKSVTVTSGPESASCTVNVVTPVSCSPPSQDVAVGAPAALSASGGDGTYAWSAPGGTPSAGSGSAFTVAYSTGGPKSVTVTSGLGGSASCTVNVVTPVSCSPPSQDVAVGAPAALSASAGDGTYVWSAPGGTPSTGSGSAFTVAYSTGGPKSVTVTSGLGGSASCTVNVEVVTCTFTADPSEIVPPSTSALSWGCVDAVSCDISPTVGPVSPVSGSVDVAPTLTTVYVLSCTGAAGAISTASAEVTVVTPTRKEVPP